MRYKFMACCSMAAAAALSCAPSTGQAREVTEARRTVDLPAQSLSASLSALGALYGRNIIVDYDLVARRGSRALKGTFALEEALDRLLAGSGLRAVHGADGISIREILEDTAAQDAIVVAGSRIRGAPVASTTLTYDRETMRDAGHASLPDLIRTIPQNFSGGQNPGVSSNAGAKNVDMGGGASLNLRGLGSDATLTLLNGRRVSFDGAMQSVDVSALPFGAIERIEIVPDGSSALFGSDAVAGVANITLRRDFDGFETSARLAGSTDGGNFQQQYGVTGGRIWSSGSVMLSGEYAGNSAIRSSQRSYLRTRSPGLEVYPRMRHHNAALTFRRTLGGALTFDLDAIYNKRRRDQVMPLNDAGDLALSRYDTLQKSRSWALAPSLTLRPGAGWELALAGSYGWNRVDYSATRSFSDAPMQVAGYGHYVNETANIELSGNGKLLDLPAGAAKLAVGTGYRRDGFLRESARGIEDGVDRSRDSYYAFGELSIPVIAPAQGSALGSSLDLSMAGRYEHYSQLGSVTTPKFGVIYAPLEGVRLKGSWGRSFRAATFYEQYSPTLGFLYDASTFGASGGTVIYYVGGNADLRPERSTNWSATLALSPSSLPHAELEISYFDIRYRDRIVTPLAYPTQALLNPAYAPFVTLAPEGASQADVIDRLVTFTNLTSATYDPSQVRAIVGNANINAGRQKVRGIDVLARYSFDVAAGRLGMALNGSYLDSEQQLLAGQTAIALAGTLFNPPHLRGRADVSWTDLGGVTLTAGLSYIGSVRDNRSQPGVRVASMLPLDLTARYRSGEEGGWLGGIDIVASVQNLFNDKPGTIATTSYFHAPYDSTNYSPFGRVISLTVSKSW